MERVREAGEERSEDEEEAELIHIMAAIQENDLGAGSGRALIKP